MSPHPKRENAEEGGEQGEDGGRGEQETQAAEPGRVPRMGQVWGGGGIQIGYKKKIMRILIKVRRGLLFDPVGKIKYTKTFFNRISKQM